MNAEKKIAVVTGASRGIGRAIALELAAKGAFVVINYNGSKEKAEAVKAEIIAAGGAAETSQCNVSDFDACGAFIKETVKKYGSAITTAKVKETILVVNEGKATIDYVPSRNNSRVAKAPQSFWLDDILTVHEKSLADGEKNCIDSCTMMQKYGYDLYLIDGPSQNIKITTPEDFYTMRAILEAKENEQIYGIED